VSDPHRRSGGYVLKKLEVVRLLTAKAGDEELGSS